MSNFTMKKAPKLTFDALILTLLTEHVCDEKVKY